VKDMEEFYPNEINNHVKVARLNYVTGVNDYLKLEHWFSAIRKRATFVKPSPMKFVKKR